MARLTRKNIKVFADSATNNGVFGSLQAGNPTTTSDVETIQSLSAWEYGWNLATMTSDKLPPLQEFQGIQYVTTYEQAYLMQEGIPEWASTVTYYKGCIAKKVTTTGFQLYNSLTDNNTNNLLSDTDHWKLIMDSDNVYAFDNAVVHLAGSETITGQKTFSLPPFVTSSEPTIALRNTGVTRVSTTDVGQENITFRDSNNDRMGLLYHVKDSSGQTYMQLGTYSHDGNSTNQILIGYDANDVSFTYAPKPPALSSTSNGSIATAGWVNDPASSLNVVHRSDNESIAGIKTFTDSPLVLNNNPLFGLKSTTAVNASTNTSDIEQIRFRDKNDVILGVVGHWQNTSGKKYTALVTYSHDHNSTAQIQIGYDGSDNVFTACEPSDENNSIVTTVSKSKSANGYYKLGNGMILQWGYNSSTTVGRTVNFNTAFSSTDYGVSIVSIGTSGGGDYSNIIGNRTSTGFNVYTNKPISWVAIGY